MKSTQLLVLTMLAACASESRPPAPPTSPPGLAAAKAVVAPVSSPEAGAPMQAAQAKKPSPHGPMSAEVAAPFQRCTADDQCTIVVNSCCEAGTGEPGIGIRRDQEAAFRALFDCREVYCTAVAQTENFFLAEMLGECGDGGCPKPPEKVARCVEGLCHFEGTW